MGSMRHLLALFGLTLCWCASSRAASIVVSDGIPTIQKAAVLGVINGHSNWHVFLRYLGVRAVRQLAQVSSGQNESESFTGAMLGSQSFGRPLDGTFKVIDRDSYNAAVEQLRTLEGRDPSYDGWVVPPKWNQIERRLATVPASLTTAMYGSANANRVVYADLGLRSLKLFVVGCNPRFVFSSASFNDELFNEPDIDERGDCYSDTSHFAETYVVRSRAIQDAFEDYSADASAGLVRCPITNVTAIRDCTLKPRMHIAAFASAVRDYKTDPKISAVFDYHSYRTEGSVMVDSASTLSGYINADHPTGLPLVLSEVNAHLALDYDKNFMDMDTPFIASKLGGQLLSMISVGVAAYVYKFSTTPESTPQGQDIITKDGILWGDNYDQPYNIGDSTLGAETVRLLALHAQSSRMYTTTRSGLAKTTYALAVREGGGADGAYYYLYLINTGAPTVLDLDFSAWSAWAGGDIITTCINGTTWSEVRDIRPVPEERVLRNWMLPSRTTQLLAVPARPLQLVRRTPITDLYVSGGANADSTYGGLQWLAVGTSARGMHQYTYVTLMRFDLPENTVRRAVEAAVLSLVTSNNASRYDDHIFQVLCLSPALWDGQDASWSQLSELEAAFLKPAPTQPITSIADNFINWPSDQRNQTVLVGGHIYVPANTTAGTSRQLDIAPCVRTMGGSPGGHVDVLIYRPYRRNAAANEVTGDGLSRGATIKFYSSEADEPAFRPTISWYI
ncbi:hypothetical protein JKP88DRAFT_245692 [Tribonema minus]|uniref:Carbohydrate-binding module family 96 domain-containing protein n=1 Tax=Tribonema minus TaxID=303371 RepID=A0A836CE18_9STRA|nr:hypothetical protein JKP88DRAFT_245692 [Tribonema minus]